MSRRVAAVMALAVWTSVAAAPACGQGGIIATPLPPPDAESTPAGPGAPPSYPRAPTFPDVWVPRGGARLQAVDKINARQAELTLRPNEPVRYQSLTIVLKSCVVRPPDQPADAAAYVTVEDGRATGQAQGLWLIRSLPASSMLQHPIFDLRVVGCVP